jgi:metallo-beta-lactamase family protein
LLVDCGLFQGLKQLRLRNREPLPVDPASIDAVLLTHAHIDHSGYLPSLVAQGFTGPVYCTQATRVLCALLLPDSGRLQEEEADRANRHGYSRHKPALPLYTQAQARAALKHFKAQAFDPKGAITNAGQ